VLDTIRSFKEKRSNYDEMRQSSFPSKNPSGPEIRGICLEPTLDEAYFPGMDAKFFETRNKEQVVSREYNRTSDKGDEDIPILMVPQLWLWKVDNILLTAYSMTTPSQAFRQGYIGNFSGFFGVGSSPSLNLQTGVIIALQISRFGQDEECPDSNVAFKSPLRIFESAVFSILSDVQEYLEAGSEVYTIAQQKKTEQRFIHDISDIHSELDMIQSVLVKQEEVLDGFLEDTKSEREESEERNALSWRKVEQSRAALDEYKKQIKKIHKDAERVEKTIESYLSLKRTYASIEDTRNSLMVGFSASAFAFVTVIFTPLSFMTSLFALPVDQFVRQQTTDGTSNDKFFKSSYIGGYLGMLSSVTGLTIDIDLHSFGGYSDMDPDRGVAVLLVLPVDVSSETTENWTNGRQERHA
jgi:hypothetical protein